MLLNIEVTFESEVLGQETHADNRHYYYVSVQLSRTLTLTHRWRVSRK